MRKVKDFAHGIQVVEQEIQCFQTSRDGQRRPKPEPAECTLTDRETRLSCIARIIAVSFFVLHLIIIFGLSIFLNVRSINNADSAKLRPVNFYPPMFIVIFTSMFVSVASSLATILNPGNCFKYAFILSPILTLFYSILLSMTFTTVGYYAGGAAFVSSATMALYSLWVTPRFTYAVFILEKSLTPTHKISQCIAIYISVVILAAAVYLCFWLLGVYGFLVAGVGLVEQLIYAIIYVLSLAWTMHVARYVVHVATARIVHVHISYWAETSASVAFRDAVRLSFGSICIGSVLVPVFGLVRSLIRMSNILTCCDETCFAPAYYANRAVDCLAMCGNRWGLVHVGTHNKGFIQSSMEAWKGLERFGAILLVDADLTVSFTVLSGIATGAFCAFVAGIWTLCADRRYVAEVSFSAFLIGYFVVKIGMAWVQGGVSAIYVSYIEDQDNPRIGRVIIARIGELESPKLLDLR